MKLMEKTRLSAKSHPPPRIPSFAQKRAIDCSIGNSILYHMVCNTQANSILTPLKKAPLTRDSQKKHLFRNNSSFTADPIVCPEMRYVRFDKEFNSLSAGM